MTAAALPVKPILEQWDDAEGQLCYRFTLPGAPRTKKNHSQAARTGRKCPTCRLGTGPARVFPSKEFTLYQAKVSEYVKTKPQLWLAIRRPVAVKAFVYRERNVGDFDGYMQALGDILQYCGILANDRYIAHRDGSRLLKDASNPRMEITITVLKADVQEEISL
jgi:Holliday junction resolvase RusA-like endonuclease